jgi:hypothetical protein
MLGQPVRRKSELGKKSGKAISSVANPAPPARGSTVEVQGRVPKRTEMTLPVQYRYAASVFQGVKNELLSRPGVSGVDIAIKTSAGSPTGKVAIRVFVEDKIPMADLFPEDVLPTEVESVPIDVVKGVFRVASGLTSIGDVIAPKTQPGDTGILTGICQDLNPNGGILLLTCAHVALGTSGAAALSSSIIIADSSNIEIGHTLPQIHGAPGWVLDADLDCVVMSPVADRTVSNVFRSGSPFEAAFVKELSATDIGLTVFRPEGSSSVAGTLTSIQNNEYFVLMGDGTQMSVTNQLVITPGNGGSFAQRGNSGELVFTSVNTAVGMVRAVNDDGIVLASPLYKTVNRMRIAILSPRH